MESGEKNIYLIYKNTYIYYVYMYEYLCVYICVCIYVCMYIYGIRKWTYNFERSFTKQVTDWNWADYNMRVMNYWAQWGKGLGTNINAKAICLVKWIILVGVSFRKKLFRGPWGCYFCLLLVLFSIKSAKYIDFSSHIRCSKW